MAQCYKSNSWLYNFLGLESALQCLIFKLSKIISGVYIRWLSSFLKLFHFCWRNIATWLSRFYYKFMINIIFKASADWPWVKISDFFILDCLVPRKQKCQKIPTPEISEKFLTFLYFLMYFFNFKINLFSVIFTRKPADWVKPFYSFAAIRWQ